METEEGAAAAAVGVGVGGPLISPQQVPPLLTQACGCLSLSPARTAGGQKDPPTDTAAEGSPF